MKKILLQEFSFHHKVLKTFQSYSVPASHKVGPTVADIRQLQELVISDRFMHHSGNNCPAGDWCPRLGSARESKQSPALIKV